MMQVNKSKLIELRTVAKTSFWIKFIEQYAHMHFILRIEKMTAYKK